MNSMNKTFTPELPLDVLERLRDYAELFRDDFRHQAQPSWSGVYLRGLIQNGERKSIEPMVDRVPLPAELRDLEDPPQALQQFVNQSPWDEQKILHRYRGVMAQSFASPQGIFVIDDTGSPKQGQHSVGVQRQYCGQLGKKANCQVAVTVHYVSPHGHFPATLRLFLPQSWTRSPQRLDEVGVPEEYRREQTKGLSRRKEGDSSLISTSVRMVHLRRTSDEKRPGRGRQRINPREFATTGPRTPETAANYLLHRGLRQDGSGDQRGVSKKVL